MEQIVDLLHQAQSISRREAERMRNEPLIFFTVQDFSHFWGFEEYMATFNIQNSQLGMHLKRYTNHHIII